MAGRKKHKNANGEGSVFFDETKGKYKGMVQIGYYDNGRPKRKSVFGNNVSEVRQKIKQIQLRIMTDEYMDESTITIRHLAVQIIEDKLNDNEIKLSTYNRHLETLKRLSEIYNTPIQKANETQIREFFRKHLDYSQSSINKEYGLMKLVFKEAVNRNIILKSPMDNIKRPNSRKITQKVRALTIEEQAKLLKVLCDEDIKYSTQMLISMYTGMRMGEINALSVTDVNFDFSVITVNRTISKGAKGEAFLSDTTKTYAGRRNISIRENIKKMLKDYINASDLKDGLIFTTPNGKLITTNQVNMELQRVLKKYDIINSSVQGKVSCHSLRHTYATRSIEGGMSAKVLQNLLGHTDITVTLNTYCDAFDSYRDDNIEKVNNYLDEIGLNIAQ